jgi:DNA-binding LacI/PurR family transcriptional regulator
LQEEPGQLPRPRIGDVAERAGVSKTAVSFAYNQPDRLNDATRGRILAAAEELGYRPSPIARRLAARRTHQVGIVVPQSTHDIFANPFLPELLRGVGDVCDAQGIAQVVVPPVQGSIASAVHEALVDGLILLGIASDHPELDQVRRAGLPIVALDVEDWDGAAVIAIDDAAGARAAADHLVQLGHRDIAAVLIAEHPDSPLDTQHGISARRLEGIRAALGGSDEAIAAADMRLRLLSAAVSEQGGREAFVELAAQGLPTGVLTMSDITAIGVMNAALDRGLSLPDELSIVGFDDIPAASWVWPRLTTVHQPIREKGRLAAIRLIEALSSGVGWTPTRELLPTHLIVRGSTSPAPTLHQLPGGLLGGGVAAS